MPLKKGISPKRQRSLERDRSRMRRERETEEESSQRRKENAERMSLHRQNETEEDSSQRRKENAYRMSLNRQNETEEESCQKRKENAETMSLHRQNESEEDGSQRRKENAARMTLHRQNETEEESSQRKREDAERKAFYRVNETEEESSQRKREDAERKAIHRLSETEEEKEYRRNLDSERKSMLREKAEPIHNIGLGEVYVEEHYIGPMNEICFLCKSRNFKEEKPSDGKFNSCCHKGKVRLDPLKPYPEILKKLLTDKNHPFHKNFIENIRAYNSALGFASLGASISPPPGYGPYCFRIHGQIYHRVGPIHPKDEKSPKFAQLYILDSDEALNNRMAVRENKKCDPQLMSQLDSLIRITSKYAKKLKMMRELELEEERKAKKEKRSVNPICMIISTDRKKDQKRYNNPKMNEVAFVFQNIDGEPPFERDLIIYSRSEQTRQLSILDANCDPMVYPILFPHSELGWDGEMRSSSDSKRNRITMLQHYSYRLAIREEFNPILNAAKLTQQYIVDAYVKIEGNRLNYIRMNQKNLRVEHYRGLMDHVHGMADNKDIKAGKMLILPSSFQGSPRAMQQNYQDAMALVRKYGKPDLFITMTCNPQWKEINENLKEWQRSEYRPDLIARVFNLKLKELKTDLMNRHILGVPVAYIYVIEFQKRGLPHAHLCIVLREEDKPRTREKIDQIVCAELPNHETHPRL